MLPLIEVNNRQRTVRFDLARLRRDSVTAVGACVCAPSRSPALLGSLGEIAVSIVSDAAISLVHGRFLVTECATDVITFEHGEIVISAETALRNAAEFATSVDHELLLYVIHGLLHLQGWDDTDRMARRRMGHIQQRILQTITALPSTTDAPR